MIEEYEKEENNAGPSHDADGVVIITLKIEQE
jgi:hypothetical protein